ncbi:hypothetical protein FI667_g12306, partial [Globisporangium splendens]
MPRVQSGWQSEQLQQCERSQSKGRDRRDTAVTTTSDECPALPPSPRQLTLERRLAEMALYAAASIPWESLRDRTSIWDKKQAFGDFVVHSRHNGDVHHVMATGSVGCSLAEMHHLLRTTTTEGYVAAMTELHGAAFLSGAVLHGIHTRNATASRRRGLSLLSLCPAAAAGVFDLSIKTATFAKAHMFAHTEQWCYLDFFQWQPEHQRFVLTMQSLSPDDALLVSNGTSSSTANNLNSTKKNQLQDISAGYSVVADPRRRLVWVMFYARFVDPGTASSFLRKGLPENQQQYASKSTTKSRLMKMAKATCCLPMLVRRRRLGVQAFVDPTAFTASNTHCICCTAALSLLSRGKNKRCYLCGYSVCLKCSTKQDFERSRNQLGRARVCRTCTRRVNAANYDYVPNGTISPCAIKRDPPGAESANLTLVKFLHESLAEESPKRKHAVVQVMKQLLEEQESSRSSTDDGSVVGGSTPLSFQEETRTENAAGSHTKALPATGEIAIHSNVTEERDSLENFDDFYMNGLEERLHVKEFALEDCVLGNADLRTYPLSYKDDSDSVPEHPVPEDEEHRLQLVHKRRLLEIVNVPELEIICSIASKELQCSAGLVTIVAKEGVHIIASSDAGYRNQVIPRDESICSHLVMSDKPFFLPHPGADVRVSKMGSVEAGRIRFYCGFPLTSSDNTVIGSVCCIDNESHDVTQSQYAAMVKLASTASCIVEMHASARAA